MQDPVLIIGASGTIGSAIARTLHADGTPVLLHGRTDGDRLRELAGDLSSPLLTGDLSVEETAAALPQALSDHTDMLSGVVFAAARPFPHKLTHRTDWSVFQEQVDSQLKALHLSLQALRPMLANRDGGARVVILSTEYVQGMPPVKIAPYVAAKSAVTAYARVIAQEWLKTGVRVHILAPGMVPSALTADMPAEYLEMVAEAMPEQTLTAAEDVAGVCRFLMTSAADPLYGTIVPVSRAVRR
ncbi:MAG: SDR family oxidoreductase [Alphaproteobacteria bacterium]